MKYIDKFLEMYCSSDILDILRPIQNTSKEISETMGMLKIVKDIVLKQPNYYNLIDLCSGNALLPVTSAFTLPTIYNCAVDIKPRDRDFDKIEKFRFCLADIYGDKICSPVENLIDNKTILTAIHPCKHLAERIIEIYNTSEASSIILMPCCTGRFKNQTNLKVVFDDYTAWCLHLWKQLPDGAKFIRDKKIESPKNILLTHSKKKC